MSIGIIYIFHILFFMIVDCMVQRVCGASALYVVMLPNMVMGQESIWVAEICWLRITL